MKEEELEHEEGLRGVLALSDMESNSILGKGAAGQPIRGEVEINLRHRATLPALYRSRTSPTRDCVAHPAVDRLVEVCQRGHQGFGRGWRQAAGDLPHDRGQSGIEGFAIRRARVQQVAADVGQIEIELLGLDILRVLQASRKPLDFIW